MIKKNGVLAFIRKNPVFFLAASEEGQPYGWIITLFQAPIQHTIFTVICLRRTRFRMWRKRVAFVAVLGIFTLISGCDKPSFKLDFSTPEKALRSLEDAYRRKNLNEVLMCKDFELEARFFVGKAADTSEYEKMLKQHAVLLEAKFKQILGQGFPEWNGVTARVLKKEELPGDMVVITEELDLPTGDKMMERIFVGKSKDGWKVLMPYSDEMKDAWLKIQKTSSGNG